MTLQDRLQLQDYYNLKFKSQKSFQVYLSLTQMQVKLVWVEEESKPCRAVIKAFWAPTGAQEMLIFVCPFVQA